MFGGPPHGSAIGDARKMPKREMNTAAIKCHIANAGSPTRVPRVTPLDFAGIVKGPDAAGPFLSQSAILVAGRACAGQQHLVDHVDHTIFGNDVGNDHIGHFTRPVGDCDTPRTGGDAQAFAIQNRLEIV